MEVSINFAPRLFTFLLVILAIIVVYKLLTKKSGAKIWLIPLGLIAVGFVLLFLVRARIQRIIIASGGDIVQSSHNEVHQISPVSWDPTQVPTIWQKSIDQQFETDVCTSSKPWLCNLSNYLNQHPDQDLMVAYSYDSCTNQAESSQQAQQQARQLIEQRVAPNRLPDNFDLNQTGIIQDRFTQRLQGSTSDIWRSALLLDLSPAKITPIAQTIHVQTRQIHRTWANQLASGLGLGIVLFLLYLFLNAATRGYYTMSLRIATAVLVVAGIAIVVWVI